MAVVYIPQEPRKRDVKTGQWVQAFDLSPAIKFGELKVLLPHGSLPIDTEPMMKNGRATIIRVDPEPNVNRTPAPQPFASCIPKPKMKAPISKDKFTGA